MTSDEVSSGTAAFNMALSSLERLNKMLIEIKKFSCMGEQRMKYQMALQFHSQSIPLITKADGKKEMEVLKGKLRILRPIKIQYVCYGKPTKTLDEFNQDLDFKIDDIMSAIQTLLQDEGYFMPPSMEEDLY